MFQEIPLEQKKNENSNYEFPGLNLQLGFYDRVFLVGFQKVKIPSIAKSVRNNVTITMHPIQGVILFLHKLFNIDLNMCDSRTFVFTFKYASVGLI